MARRLLAVLLTVLSWLQSCPRREGDPTWRVAYPELISITFFQVSRRVLSWTVLHVRL